MGTVNIMDNQAATFRKKRCAGVILQFCAGLLGTGQLAGCQQARPDPSPHTLAYYTALSRQDWKAVYPLTAFAPEEREVYKDAPDFAQKMEKQLAVDGPEVQGFSLLKDLSEIAVGTPTVSGDKADVPTSATLTYQGKPRHFHGVAHMVYQDGGWKFDTSASGTDVTAKAIAQLLGQAEQPVTPMK